MLKNCSLDVLLPEDFPFLCELFTSAEVREFLGGPVNDELARQRSKKWIELSSTDPIWAIRRSGDRAFLGYVILSGHHNGRDTEISYALLPQYWGKGYATSALNAGFKRASTELGMSELVAETQLKNSKSTKLLERVGMIEDSRLTRFNEEQVIYRIKLESNKTDESQFKK